MITTSEFDALPLASRVEHLRSNKHVPKWANLFGANLFEANLSGADLSGANLAEADLSKADLSKADLSKADLAEADLSGAKLFGVKLLGADLSRANLAEADLSKADLSGVKLFGANLSGAKLFGANLSGADLSGANLSGAKLSGANLTWADLSGADLSEAKLVDTCLCPDLHKSQRQFTIDTRQKGIVFYRTSDALYCGSTKYIPGKTYVAPWFSMDTMTACHPGIYGGTLPWMVSRYRGYDLVKCYTRAGDYVFCAKGCIRCKRMRVLCKA